MALLPEVPGTDTGPVQAIPAGPNPGAPPASPPSSKATLSALLMSAFTLFATYAGLIAILLPLHIMSISDTEEQQVARLGIVMTVSFIFTLFAQPMVGAFSDRTRSKFGRRTTWMLFGAFIGGIMLLGMGQTKNLFFITLFWVVIQVALNAVQGPLSAVIPDRFPKERRGGASAMMGIGMQLGGAFGVVVAGQFADNFGMGYAVFGILVIVFTVLFAILNKDWSSKEAMVDPWNWSAFIKGFWVSPKEHPDFGWAFAARFLLMLGYFGVTSYQLYLLTYYIGMSKEEATAAVVTLTLVAFVPTLLAIGLSGWWSDKVGRRKIFIYVASAILAAGLAVPLFLPTMTGMIIMAIINGIGFGLYMSVDTALMTEVLPGGGDHAGKDLGLLNIATNIPQAMSPAIAGFIILNMGGYSTLFIVAIVFVIIAAFAVVPIKAVR